MPKLIYADLFAGMDVIADVVFNLAFKIIGVFMIMALMDLYYQKWQNNQDNSKNCNNTSAANKR